MQIQTNTNSSIEGREELAQQTETILKSTLGRFSDRITRVEAHLSDVNSHKPGEDDKRCLLEARLKGLQPIAVSHQAGTLPQAIRGAADKLKRALDSTLGRLDSHQSR
jgi:hypothetical protein